MKAVRPHIGDRVMSYLVYGVNMFTNRAHTKSSLSRKALRYLNISQVAGSRVNKATFDVNYRRNCTAKHMRVGRVFYVIYGIRRVVCCAGKHPTHSSVCEPPPSCPQTHFALSNGPPSPRMRPPTLLREILILDYKMGTLLSFAAVQSIGETAL